MLNLNKLQQIVVQKKRFYFSWYYAWKLSRKITIDPNKVIFFTFNDMFTCNPKYIAKELLKYNNIQLVWVTNKKVISGNHFFPKGIKLVYNHSKEFYNEVLSAKVIIDNGLKYQEGHYIPKKKGQIYIQAWHGSLGIKKFGPDSDSVKSRVKAGKRCGRLTDYCISNSTFESLEVYQKVYWKNSQILEFGHPRNDILVNYTKKEKDLLKAKIFSRYNISYDKNIVLYAPTFRDSKSLDAYSLDYKQLKATLAKKFGGDWIILVRYHFVNRAQAEAIKSSSEFINVSSYTDMQELLTITDVGITDYSSWIFDYMLTHRPAFIFATDIKSYVDERGFYYPLSSTPFSIASTNDELSKNILEFDNFKYQKNIDQFLNDKGCKELGNASVKSAEKIIEMIEGD